MERFDNSKQFILRTILKNNRLKTYRRYITFALDNGYRVCGLEEFYQNRGSKDRFFVLRHDVDTVTPATYQMLLVEKELGVKSTYYFRTCTIDKKLIDNMFELGFEVGFHYETLAAYAADKGIECFEEVDLNEAREQLKKEILEFQLAIGHKILSIASHGHALNTKMGYSNNYILENDDYVNYGIMFEAYDRDMYKKKIDCHIMDGHICFNYGFAYENNPIEAINENKKNIIFLAHPNFWYGDRMRQAKDFIYYIMGKGDKYKIRSFKRLAKGSK